MQPDHHSLSIRPKLGEKDFEKISSYIQKNFGIKLPLSKMMMVESRLIKRVIKLNVKNFSDYVSYVFSKEGVEEQIELIDFICTNKTDFFREDHHFSFLESHVQNLSINRSLKIWSSACSSGEEPYTIAMVLEEMKSKKVGFDYHILATDISSAVLQKANTAEYQIEKLSMVPQVFQKKYFNHHEHIAKVVSQIKSQVTFEKFNLVDDTYYSRVPKSFDVIFCRNVLIYFDHATQTKVVSNLISKLAPGGVLCLGHSETLLGRNFNLSQIRPTIYQKPQ